MSAQATGPRVETSAPRVETKVKAATAGATFGAVFGEFVNWLIDSYAITPGITGDLPTPVSAMVLTVCAAAVSFGAGWWARHSPRHM